MAKHRALTTDRQHGISIVHNYRVGHMLIALYIIVAASGCATVVGSFDQPIVVNAVCEGAIIAGAVCSLKNDKGSWGVSTPGSITIRKSYEALDIECKYGASQGSASFVSMSNTSFANVIVGGGVGYLVDSGTGAGFDYPGSATVVLNPPCQPKEGNTK